MSKNLHQVLQLLSGDGFRLKHPFLLSGFMIDKWGMDEKVIKDLLQKGIFQELDIHFAKLMLRLSDKASPGLFLASALVSRATSQGNVCLDLEALKCELPYRQDPLPDDLETPALKEWICELKSSPVVGRPGEYKPLILDSCSRLYLYRYWEYEDLLSKDLRARSERRVQGIDASLLKNGLLRLFEGEAEDGSQLQMVAAFISLMKGLCVISGGPGTGKSTLISKILALILEQDREARISLAAPTGKAAARLQEAVNFFKQKIPFSEEIKRAIPTEASTIHRLLGTIPGSPYFRHNQANPLSSSVVVIDEASMVDLALLSKLVQAIPTDARIILLGDKDQLASVEAGAVLGDICGTGGSNGFSENFSTSFLEITGIKIRDFSSAKGMPKIRDCLVQLTKSYRFPEKSGIYEVSRTVNEGRGEAALDILKDAAFKDISWKSLPEPSNLKRAIKDSVLSGFAPFLETASDPSEVFSLFERFRILCALRKGAFGVDNLNRLVEDILRDEKLIDNSRRWYRGRPILVTRNDYNLGLFNGDIGIVLEDPSEDCELRAFFKTTEGLRRLPPVNLPQHETVFAMTVHKSQGSEFDTTMLVLPDYDSPLVTRELIYTGITRTRKRAQVWAKSNLFTAAAKRRIERASGLRAALWEEKSST